MNESKIEKAFFIKGNRRKGCIRKRICGKEIKPGQQKRHYF